MKIIIIGAGDVGSYLSDKFSQAGHDITLLDVSPDACRHVDETQNVRVVCGNGTSAEVLLRIGVKFADFVLVMTMNDATNMMGASIAKALGAQYVISRIHELTYRDYACLDYQLHFGIDACVSPEYLCAFELAKSIRNPNRVTVEHFARGKVELRYIQLEQGNSLVGTPLRELGWGHNMRIVYVQRSGSVEIAKGETVLNVGDGISIIGSLDAFEENKKVFQRHIYTSLDNKNIVLYGGSEVAKSLIVILKNPRFRIRLIEKDPLICEQFAEDFEHVTVIHGDATSLHLLEEEHIEKCDYFLACTKDDEDNIMTSLQAKHLGVQSIGVVINAPNYERFLGDLKDVLKIDHWVSPRLSMFKELNFHVHNNDWMELAQICDKQLVVMQFLISEKLSIEGMEVRNISWPKGATVVIIVRNMRSKVAQAEDVLSSGDALIMMVTKKEMQVLIDLVMERA